MKKTLAAVLAALSIIYLFNNCSGHVAAAPVSAETREKTPFETLLITLEWTGGGERLIFRSDFTGEACGVPITWAAAPGGVRVRFFPGCFAGRTAVFTASVSGGLPRLRRGDTEYVPSLFAGAHESLPQPSAEELLGQAIAEYAVGFIGWNYKYGGKSPETGFDCSGLVYYVYEQFGYRLERVASEQAKQGTAVAPEELMPGDLLAFHTSGKYVGHIGIYVGDGYYVHAMGSAYGVVLTSLDDPYLKRDYDARRIVGCDELKISGYTASPAPIVTPTPPGSTVSPAPETSPSPTPTSAVSPLPTPAADPPAPRQSL